MKNLMRSIFVFVFNVLAGTAMAQDLQTAAVAPAKTEIVTQLSQAVQNKDWAQSEKLATAAIDLGGLTVNEKTAALSNLCIALAQQRAFTQALAACNKSVAIAPARAGSYVNRGNLYAKLGKPTLAAADYAKAKSLEPNNTIADINLTSMRWNEEHHYVALIANYDN